MGKVCTIEKERGGSCTSYDGTIDKNIFLEKGSNAWKSLEKVVDEGVWCESCKDDGKKGLSALHDVVNLTIGETTEAYDPRNLKRFAKRVDDALKACTNCHIKEPA